MLFHKKPPLKFTRHLSTNEVKNKNPSGKAYTGNFMHSYETSKSNHLCPHWFINSRFEIAHFTGVHQERAYTFLGISCPQQNSSSIRKNTTADLDERYCALFMLDQIELWAAIDRNWTSWMTEVIGLYYLFTATNANSNIS